MKIRKLLIILTAVAVSGAAWAQRLPSYYPESFQRTGTVDDIREGEIVVNDIQYVLGDSVVVHTLSEQKAPVSRLRRGALIGYRLADNREIVEIWLLPVSYEANGRRR